MAVHNLAQPTRYIAKSALKSSVVLQAIVGHIRHPASEDIVFGKETAIELLTLDSDDQLESLHEQLVFGTIIDLKLLPWNAEFRSSSPQVHGKDLVVVLSDSGKLSFLTFSIEAHRFLALVHINVSFPGLPRELGHQLAVECRGRAIAVAGLEDRIAVFPASSEAGTNFVEKGLLYPRGGPPMGIETATSTALGAIWSMAFVDTDTTADISSNTAGMHHKSALILAILLRRQGALASEVHVVACNAAERAIQLRFIYHCDSGPVAGPLPSTLISVPMVAGALLLARAGDLALLHVSFFGSPKVLSQAFIPLQDRQGPSASSSKAANQEDSAARKGGGSYFHSQSMVDGEPGSEQMDGNGRQEKEGFDLLLKAADVEAGLYHPQAGFVEAAVQEGEDMDDHGRAGITSADPPIIVAWSWETSPKTKGPSVLVVATDAGAIHRVYLSQDDAMAGVNMAEKTHMRILPACYQGAACSSLLCLREGHVLAIGDMGDGHLLHAESNGSLAPKSSLQNIAPIFDFELVDYDGEKQDQMVACCGANKEGSLRTIRNAISVEQLLVSPPTFLGITATWPLRIRRSDPYHSLLVMSFLEETRVLSVGPSFDDRTDTTGFNSGASTLACGRVEDGWLVQVCAAEIRICAPAIESNSHVPYVSSWAPPTLAEGGGIRVGAVAQGVILVALSRLGSLLLLGTELGSDGLRHVLELQKCQINAEISCIAIPQEEKDEEELPERGSVDPTSQIGVSTRSSSFVENGDHVLVTRAGVGRVCIVGTYQPSVEILSLVPGEAFRTLAVAPLAQTSPIGPPQGGCIPESVQLIQVDHLYVLVGLRNGMLLRYQWSASALQTSSVLRKHPAPISSKSPSAIPPSGPLSTPSFMHPSAQPTMDGRTESLLTSSKTTSLSGNRERANLHLVDVRRIGVSPVSLVLLKTSLCSDVVALSDRPWLLQVVQHRQRIAYTPISFRASSHATALSCAGCPLGLLFIADCCLHLVEMEQSKRLSVQQIPVGRTPRHVVYHSASKSLILICESVGQRGEPPVCEIRCLDPVGGRVHFVYKLDAGELALSIQLWQPRDEQLVAVGTGPSAARPFLPHDADESLRGRLLIFRVKSKLFSVRSRNEPASPAPEAPLSALSGPGSSSAVSLGTFAASALSSEPSPSWGSSGRMKGNLAMRETFEGWSRERSEGVGHNVDRELTQEGEAERSRNSEESVQAEGSWELQLHISFHHVSGPVMCLCTYLGIYLLAGAGNALVVLSMVQDENGRQRLKRMSKAMTRFGITCISTHLTRIAVGDCRDGVLLYAYREDAGLLELLLCDPAHRLVADCALLDPDTAIVTDRYGNLCSLTASSGPEGSPNPERNLDIGCWFHMAEIAPRIRKGSLAYRAPMEDMREEPYKSLSAVRASKQSSASTVLVAATMLGSVVFFLRLTREEYELLGAVERRVAAYHLTSPLLGNDHARFRSRGSPPGVARVLDGDMLGQFLELTMAQQQMVLSKRLSRPLEPGEGGGGMDCGSRRWQRLAWEGGEEEEVADLPLETVLRLLERVHHSIG